MRKRMFAVLLILATVNGVAVAQTPAPQGRESQKYRTILTAAGAGGGFGLGVVVGLSAFDDAKYADRKVWTTALLSSAAAGVAGYFIGRSLDKSRARSRNVPASTAWAPDALERSLLLQEAAGRVSFPARASGPASSAAAVPDATGR